MTTAIRIYNITQSEIQCKFFQDSLSAKGTDVVMKPGALVFTFLLSL